jgi:hypothetical protein
MRSSNSFLWGLSICNKKLNIVALANKVIVLSWWVSRIHMNPNQKDVIRKKLALHSYDEKPIQYLMEMHVRFFHHLLFYVCCLYPCVLCFDFILALFTSLWLYEKLSLNYGLLLVQKKNVMLS